MSAMTAKVPTPAEIAAALSRRVLGQESSVREMAVALSKQLAGLRTGNILMIGTSGSGKTTLMRAVEARRQFIQRNAKDVRFLDI